MGFKAISATEMQEEGASMVVSGDLIVDMAEAKFTAEDVEHIDDVIMEIKHASNATSLEGLEWLRNKVAARAGVEMKDEGAISYPTN